MLGRTGGFTQHLSRRRIGFCFAVVALTVLVRPFPVTRAGDQSAWGADRLADALAQVEQGIFPVYVGQTDAVPDGTPHAGAPLQHWTGVVLRVLTLGRYAPPDIIGLIALWSALGGLCAAYLGLRVLLCEHPQLRLLHAASYVIACGVLWQFGSCTDTAFVAVPYAPLLFCALVRGAARPDAWASGGTAVLLALLWLAHPPSGLTATTLCAVCIAGWSAWRGRSALRPVLWTATLFGLLSAWFFAGAGVLGVFPVRSAWLTDQCAVPAAALGAGAALWLRHLLTGDRWELALQVERESGSTDDLVRCGPATLAALGVSVAVLAGLLALVGHRISTGPGSDKSVAVEGPEPRFLQPIAPQMAQTDRPLSTDDPVLRNSLHQSAAGAPLPTIHNDILLPYRIDRPGDAVPQPERLGAGYVPVHARDGWPIMRFNVEPGKRYVLTVEYWTRNYRGAIRLDGETIHRTTPLPEHTGGPQGVRGLRLFVCDASTRPQVVEVSLVGRATSAEPDGGVYCGPVGLSAYRPDDLPIRVSSLAPYTAVVRVDGSEGFVVTHRRFVPGYRALVNGKRAHTFRSADGNVAVQLPHGTNEVQLRYRGTTAMRVGFVVSALTALGLAVAAVRSGWRSLRLRNAPVRAESDRAGPVSLAA